MVGEPGIGELEVRRLALELAGDIEQIAGVEADLERASTSYSTPISSVALPPSGLLTDSTSLSALMLSFTARPRSLAMVDTRSTALMNSALETFSSLSLAFGITRAIVGEGAVDQLRGQRDGADLEARLGRRHADVARCSSLSSIRRCSSCTVLRGRMMPGMPSAPLGAGSSAWASRWPSVATARSVGSLPRCGGVQIDAVEVVARLFRGDGKARLVDQALQVLGGDLELVAELAGGEIGKILRRQRLQREAGLAGAQRQALLLGVALDLHLGAVGQLAHDVVQHVRRHRHGAGLRDVGRRLVRHLALEVGRLELQRPVRRP